MKIAFLKEAGKYVRKEFTDTELVDWFKENSNDEGEIQLDIITYGTIEIKADEEGFPWVLSDFTLDRDMERMDPRGWDLKEYKKNPIVLFGHDSYIPAIGKTTNIKKSTDENGNLSGTVVFDESGLDPLAMSVASKVRNGFLTKGSVGFRTSMVEILDGSRDGTRLIHRKMELMEFSVCNIPSNPNAQVQRSAEPGKPKHYTEELMQINDERNTSADGNTSRIEDLFNASRKGNTNIQELFNAKN